MWVEGWILHPFRMHGVAGLTQTIRQPLGALTELGKLPFGYRMDGPPDQVIPLLDRVKASGTAMLGMKILGLGDGVPRIDECLSHAVNTDCIDAFTISFDNTAQIDEVINRIAML